MLYRRNAALLAHEMVRQEAEQQAKKKAEEKAKQENEEETVVDTVEQHQAQLKMTCNTLAMGICLLVWLKGQAVETENIRLLWNKAEEQEDIMRLWRKEPPSNVGKQHLKTMSRKRRGREEIRCRLWAKMRTENANSHVFQASRRIL